jgi:excisionase family DNA binding protein
MPKNQSSVMTIGELSKYLKISQSTLYKLAQAGRVPCQKVGRHWRFHKDAIDAWLCERNDGAKPNDRRGRAVTRS